MRLKNWPEILPTAVREDRVEYIVSHNFAGRENLTDISLLEELSFTSPWKRESLEAELANPLNLTSLIRQPSADEIAGYSLTRVIQSEAELLRIAVRPAARKVGIGRRLLDELLRKLFTLKVTRIYLEVSEQNQAALSLYRKIGFTETGRRPGYYDNSTTGAINFALTIKG